MSTQTYPGAGTSTTYGDEHPGGGWISFAGVMICIVATLNIIDGIAAISNSKFFVGDAKYVLSDLNTWGWVNLVIGCVQVLVAVGIWAGNQVARWTGIVIVSLKSRTESDVRPIRVMPRAVRGATVDACRQLTRSDAGSSGLVRRTSLARPTAGNDKPSEDEMCRWMAWMGQPILIEELLFKTQHGLVDQSLEARMGAEPTNGDGFGMGWYGTGEGPALYHSVSPAWSDANLRELAGHVESSLFLAHVRAAIGSPVQQTNCHPFRRGRWLFVHNGYVADFPLLRRDLMVAIDPELFADVRGSTDTEVVFHLALTYGLMEDPIAALERTVWQIEETGRRHGRSGLVQGTFGVSDGVRLWGVRYATEGTARTLFASEDVDTLRRLHPDNPRLQGLRDDDRVIVSEPFADLPGAWHEIPQSSAVIAEHGGGLEHLPFQPRPSHAHRVAHDVAGAADG